MASAAGMYYFSYGDETSARPSVILIHGAGGTHLNWPPQIRRLAGQRMLALDLPGHGRSEGVGRQLIADYAADVVRFMDTLRLPAAILAGHSMGAAIALTMALKHPKRLVGMALLGSSARMPVSPAILRGAADRSTFRATVELITGHSYSLHTDPRLKELAARRMAESRPSVLHGDFVACDHFNVTDELGRVRTPTLIIAAEEDRMIPAASSRGMQRQIPGAQLRMVPDAGHMLMLERPEAVA
ncbi:MAG: alpha/beta fold hydrolase, partial [Bacteroidota bacterium]